MNTALNSGRRLRSWLLGALVIGVVGFSGQPLSGEDSSGALMREYGVKAGFVYNFLGFVTWPSELLPPETPWRIGIVDDGEGYHLIADSLQGKTFGNRPIEVKRVSDSSSLQNLHVLFVTRQAKGDLDALLADARQLPILVIGETPGFARDDGVVGFVQRGSNLRLEINVVRAQDQGLIVSSRLSSVAEIVRPRS